MGTTTAITDRTLGELEVVIERGHQTFLAVAYALLEVRERKLYRERQYRSFEEYCRERWGWSVDYGYKMIRSAEVARTLLDRGLPAPKNERQVRELARIKDPEERADVWRIAREEYGNAVSVAAVEQIVDDRLGVSYEEKRQQRQAAAQQARAVETILTDPTGRLGQINARSRYMDARHAAGKLCDFPPAAYVPLMEDFERDATRRLIARMRQWCDEMDAELGRGLRVIGGTQTP